MPEAHIVFRVDASARIGTGHVMRCLTLANEMLAYGVVSHFICRAHTGHMAEKIRSEGHAVTLLPAEQEISEYIDESARYASWLGADWLSDAEATVQSVAAFQPRWVVVDHYAIDFRWERLVKAATKARIMVIDGLADRTHDCDVLLDQTCSPEGKLRWVDLVPESCELLVGPRFALLRPDFAEARRNLRQRDGKIRRIFIAFGGVDEPNATLAALDAILELELPDVMVDVVVGFGNPHQTQLKAHCQQFENVCLHVQPANMAELMMNADLAISGGGTMLLEQCYLNLPSVVISIANNQVASSRFLSDIGAVIYLGNFDNTTKAVIKQSVLQLFNDKQKIKKIQSITEKLMAEPETKVSQVLLRDL